MALVGFELIAKNLDRIDGFSSVAMIDATDEIGLMQKRISQDDTVCRAVAERQRQALFIFINGRTTQHTGTPLYPPSRRRRHDDADFLHTVLGVKKREPAVMDSYWLAENIPSLPSHISQPKRLVDTEYRTT